MDWSAKFNQDSKRGWNKSNDKGQTNHGAESGFLRFQSREDTKLFGKDFEFKGQRISEEATRAITQAKVMGYVIKQKERQTYSKSK